jgi:hypothetical protein
MAKIRLFDKDGKEVFFDYAVDAREGIEKGFYFETNPTLEGSSPNESSVYKEEQKKESKKEKKEPVDFNFDLTKE